jgi:hypothetical protein
MSSCTIDKLPRELIAAILTLTGSHASIAARTSKAWRRLVSRSARLYVSAAVRNTSLMDWACRQGCPLEPLTCACAVEFGDLDVLMFLREERECPWDAWTTAVAAMSGRTETLRWAHDNGCPSVGRWIVECAAMRGDMPTLRWAIEDAKFEWSPWALAYASREGHEEVAAWARARGCPEPDSRHAPKPAGKMWRFEMKSRGMDRECSRIKGDLPTSQAQAAFSIVRTVMRQGARSWYDYYTLVDRTRVHPAVEVFSLAFYD